MKNQTKPFNQKSPLIFEVEEPLSILKLEFVTLRLNILTFPGFIFFVTFLLLVKIAIVVLLFIMQDEIRPTLTKLWNNSKVNYTIFYQKRNNFRDNFFELLL